MTNEKILKYERLNIGCGIAIEENAINLNLSTLPRVDVVWDLDKFPYPFPDNTFKEILAQDIMEHLDDIFKVMEEVWRILKPGGTIYIHTTFWKTEDSYTDPTHKHFFTLRSFDYFDPSKDLGGLKYGWQATRKFKILKKYLDKNGFTNFLLKKI